MNAYMKSKGEIYVYSVFAFVFVDLSSQYEDTIKMLILEK